MYIAYMKAFVFLGLLFFNIVGFRSEAQMYIEVTSIPPTTPAASQIYLAGSINSWNPMSATHECLYDSTHLVYRVEILTSGSFQFKFTRGSWPTVEGSASGAFIPNRNATYSQGDTLRVQILGWEGIGGGGSTAASNVSIIPQFSMHPLNRQRDVWIYLPPDYNTSVKDYPLFILQDGQNLFDSQTSFSGEWEVDESLNDLFNQGDYGAIVVGIENGGGLRIDEYSPWVGSQGGGEGWDYIDFVHDSLMNFMTTNYRVQEDQIFIGGSSLGALISVAALAKYPNSFAGALLFSPAYWYNQQIFGYVENHTSSTTGNTRTYSIAGSSEGSGSVATNVFRMDTMLIRSGFTDNRTREYIHSDGQHSEWYWAREFAEAYIWLTRGWVTVVENQLNRDYRISYNLNLDRWHIQCERNIRDLRLFNLEGKECMRISGLGSKDWSGILSIQKNKTYVLQIQFEDGSLSGDTLRLP